MAGICGVFNHPNLREDVDEQTVAKMKDALLHRGPHGGGIYVSPDRRVALGYRHLKIMDDSQDGNQPLSNEDGDVWVVLDGRIYNHAEIGKQLRKEGYASGSVSEAQSVLLLYLERGLESLESLEGAYAFCIWDGRYKRLILARDSFGAKPLYYAFKDGKFIFASEIKAILEHPAISREIDEVAIYHYLTFNCSPSPMTLFREIRKVPSGTVLVLNEEQDMKVKKLSDLAEYMREARDYTEDYCVEVIRHLLSESVKKRMESNVPLGAFLSGGLDSSLNVALMSRLSAKPVSTFFVAFRGKREREEIHYARQVAERFGCEHHEQIVGMNELHASWPKLIFHLDDLLGYPDTLAHFCLAKLSARNGVTVTHLGEVADEVFFGRPEFLDFLNFYHRKWLRYQALPLSLRKLAYVGVRAYHSLAWQDHNTRGLANLGKSALMQEAYWGWKGAFTEEGKRYVVCKSFWKRHPGLTSYDVVRPFHQRLAHVAPNAAYMKRMMYLEFKNRLPEQTLMRIDKLSSAWSTESRLPFIDSALVRFAMSIPPEIMIRNQPKYILKKAAEGLLPDPIIYRDKAILPGEALQMLRRFFGQVSYIILDSEIWEREIFNFDRIKTMLNMFKSGRRAVSGQIWSLFLLFLWYRYWIERKGI